MSKYSFLSHCLNIRLISTSDDAKGADAGAVIVEGPCVPSVAELANGNDGSADDIDGRGGMGMHASCGLESCSASSLENARSVEWDISISF